MNLLNVCTKSFRTTVEKGELLEYFKDFNILYFSEGKYYKDAIGRKNKFWHVYTIIAQKQKLVKLNHVIKIETNN